MSKVVKICGIKTLEAAHEACNAGSDLLGIIMVPNRARSIDFDIAKEISKLVRGNRDRNGRKNIQQIFEETSGKSFDNPEDYFIHLSEEIKRNGPFLVGVFRNQHIEDVFRLAEETGVDFIQLHGSENKAEFLARNSDFKYGIIPRFVIPSDNDVMFKIIDQYSNKFGLSVPLLDSELGGEGKNIDWSAVKGLPAGKFILAGGLTPYNLHQTRDLQNVIGFDVSGGVEDEHGSKDIQKINDFINTSKSI